MPGDKFDSAERLSQSKQTRNKIGWEFFKDQEGFVKQYYADYCFATSEIDVKNFEVPYVEVSDHLPLILKFEI